MQPRRLGLYRGLEEGWATADLTKRFGWRNLHLSEAPEQYSVAEIKPMRRQYRVVYMLVIDPTMELTMYLLTAFRKTGDENRRHLWTAAQRAKKVWRDLREARDVTEGNNGMVHLTGTLEEGLLDAIGDNEARAVEVLRAQFLRGISRQLYRARREAGLSQQDLAQMLHTTQSSISRTECDKAGAMSMKRFVDWMIACDAVPTAVQTVATEAALDVVQQRIAGRSQTSVGHVHAD